MSLRVLAPDAAREGCRSFLQSVRALSDERRHSEAQAVDRVLEPRAEDLQNRAVRCYDSIAAVAAALLPRIALGEGLPRAELDELNRSAAHAFGDFDVFQDLVARPALAQLVSPMTLPENLLAAEPGHKLFAGLQSKVKSICALEKNAIEARSFDAARAALVTPGVHAALQIELHKLEERFQVQLQGAREEQVEALAQSDHVIVSKVLPISLSIGAEPTDLSLVTWNVLEFPLLAEDAVEVLDGINPPMAEMLRDSGLKEKQAADMLRDAMRSKPVISAHLRLVTQELQRMLSEDDGPAADILFLQELNSDMMQSVSALCAERGWSVTVSRDFGEAGKCEARTAIVSREPFDEATDVQVTCTGVKMRHFAAGRRGGTWFVACHVPVGKAKKAKKGAVEEPEGVELALEALSVLADQLVVGSDHTCLVAAGDWNSHLPALGELLNKGAAGLSEKGLTATLHTTDGPTVMGREWPIDGVIVMRK